MDRRSWLWRRKSSDKSTGDTESSGSGSVSGSISSPSERFSDDQQAYANQNPQEFSSKAVQEDEDMNDSLKILTEKLSSALATVSAKEELVQQHAKVAEEAVTGWEKAEKEATSLKQQLVHLDGALKECMRQLRQVREEQQQKIQDAETQLETANAKVKAFSSLESDLRVRLGCAEKENESLQLKLRSMSEELEIRSLERDLSAKTAETASKQHLESVKKVAKLEAECRRLKSMARKANSFNHQNLFKLETSSMNDFLEMERLAELPMRENRIVELEKKIEMLEEQKEELGRVLAENQDQLKNANKKVGMLQSELDLADDLRQAIELELEDANLRKEEVESQLKSIDNEREIMLSRVQEGVQRYAEITAKCQSLEDEVSRIKQEAVTREGVERENIHSANAKREEAESQLNVVQAKCIRLEEEVCRRKLEADSWKSQVTLANNSKEAVQRELEMTNAKKYSVESRLKAAEAEAKSLLARVGSLELEVEKARVLSAEFSSKCKKLEDDVSKLKCGAEFPEEELSVAATKLAECQRTIASLGKQLTSLATLDDLFLDPNKVIEVYAKESQLVQKCEQSTNLPTTGNKEVLKKSGALQLPSEIIRDYSPLRMAREAKKDGKDNNTKSLKSGFGNLFPQSKSSIRS